MKRSSKARRELAVRQVEFGMTSLYQCKAITSHGTQCEFEAPDNRDYCSRHEHLRPIQSIYDMPQFRIKLTQLEEHISGKDSLMFDELSERMIERVVAAVDHFRRVNFELKLVMLKTAYCKSRGEELPTREYLEANRQYEENIGELNTLLQLMKLDTLSTTVEDDFRKEICKFPERVTRPTTVCFDDIAIVDSSMPVDNQRQFRPPSNPFLAGSSA